MARLSNVLLSLLSVSLTAARGVGYGHAPESSDEGHGSEFDLGVNVHSSSSIVLLYGGTTRAVPTSSISTAMAECGDYSCSGLPVMTAASPSMSFPTPEVAASPTTSSSRGVSGVEETNWLPTFGPLPTLSKVPTSRRPHTHTVEPLTVTGMAPIPAPTEEAAGLAATTTAGAADGEDGDDCGGDNVKRSRIHARLMI